MAKQSAANVQDSAETVRDVTLVDGDKYFFGNVSEASDDFDAIMSTNSTAADMVELFKKALAGDVEGVEVTGLTCDSFTLAITNDAGRTDIVNVDVSTYDVGGKTGFDAIDTTWFGGNVGDKRSDFNVIDLDVNGKASKIIGTSKNYFDQERGETTGGIGDLVGGSAKGDNDFQALFEAGLKGDDNRVKLLDFDIEEEWFTFQVIRNDAVDTFVVKNADFLQESVESIFGTDSLINPGDSGSQFVFVDETTTGVIGIGIDDIRTPDNKQTELGGSLKADELSTAVEIADDIEGIDVDTIGPLTQITFTENANAPDVVTIETDLLV